MKQWAFKASTKDAHFFTLAGKPPSSGALMKRRLRGWLILLPLHHMAYGMPTQYTG